MTIALNERATMSRDMSGTRPMKRRVYMNSMKESGGRDGTWEVQGGLVGIAGWPLALALGGDLTIKLVEC